MITYEYECENCKYNFEVQQSIKDDAFTVCPECEHETLHRVINTPLYIRVVGEPTTIGQLAERNTKRMSTEQIEALQQKHKTKKTISRIPDDRRPATQPGKPIGDMPEWIKRSRTKTTEDVIKMTPQQQERYIHTGK